MLCRLNIFELLKAISPNYEKTEIQVLKTFSEKLMKIQVINKKNYGWGGTSSTFADIDHK